MGFTKADFPPVDPETFLQQPLMERMKVLALHWVEHGFGSPRMIHTIYVVKLLVFYVLGGITVATWTSHLPPFWDVAGWWNQPIVYEKAVLWTVLLETIGVAGSWGPLAGKFKPMTGSIRFWASPGTIRLRPWRRDQFTPGDLRFWLEVQSILAPAGERPEPAHPEHRDRAIAVQKFPALPAGGASPQHVPVSGLGSGRAAGQAGDAGQALE